MKSWFKGFASLLSVVLLLVATTAKADQLGEYAVAPLLPQFQTKGVEHFFDMGWTPNQSDQLGIRITNKTRLTTTYQLNLNKARTNRNGVIDYADVTAAASRSTYHLNDLVKLPSSVTVKGESSEVVTADIHFDKADFKGILMGGIHVSKKSSEQPKGLSHTVSYNIPLIIRGNGAKRPKPKLTLTGLKVVPILNKQLALDVSIHNQRANFLKEVNFEAVITNSRGDVVDQQSSTWDLTPETRLQYPVKLAGRYQAGTYQLELTAKHRSEHQWQFKEKFMIKAADAKQLKKKQAGSMTGWFSLVIALLIIIVYLLVKRFKKQR